MTTLACGGVAVSCVWPVASRGRSHPGQTTPLSSVLSCSFYIWCRLHVLKHALLVSFAKFFNLATWRPSLKLTAKFETWQPISNMADLMEETRGKHTETKKLGSQTQTWQGLCQVQVWLPSSKLSKNIETWQDQMSRMWYCSTISYNMHCIQQK